MQNKARVAVLALLMTSLLAAPLAEAKRAGGGKSYGMSRSQSSSQSYNQNSYSQPSSTYRAPAQTQTQNSGSGVGKMVAAGVAGAAIGAVAANALADNHNGQQANPNQQASNWQSGEQAKAQENKSNMSWLWLILLAGAAFFLFRKFSAKKQAENGSNPYAPNNTATTRSQNAAPFGQPTATAPANNTNIFGQSVAGGAAPVQAPFGAATFNSGNPLPDGSEPATFLRFARQRFNHIQAMNNASNIREIEKYFTPDLYQAIYAEIADNKDVAEFSNLTANVVDQATENGQYVVSVRFTGTVSEDLNSLPQPFTEIWHFVKPIGSVNEWLVAGIQQV